MLQLKKRDRQMRKYKKQEEAYTKQVGGPRTVPALCCSILLLLLLLTATAHRCLHRAGQAPLAGQGRRGYPRLHRPGARAHSTTRISLNLPTLTCKVRGSGVHEWTLRWDHEPARAGR